MGEHGGGWRGTIERRQARRQAANARGYARRHARDRKRGTLRGWPAVRALLTVALLAFAAYILGGAAFAHHEASVLRDERELAAGRVEKAVRNKDQDYAKVRFATRDGRTVSAKVTAWKDLPARGDRVTVCYAPRDPDRHVQDARVCPDFAGPRNRFIAGVAALAVLAACWTPWLLRRTLRRRS